MPPAITRSLRRMAPLALLLVLALGGAAQSTSAASEPSASVPPNLEALVARSQSLPVPFLIATERLSLSGHGHTATLISAREQASASPSEVAVSAAGAFSPGVHARYLGGKVYWQVAPMLARSVPGLRSRLRGRRWIELGPREIRRAHSLSAPTPIKPAAPNPLDAVGLAPLVAIDTDVVETGPVTVGGQPAFEFTGSVDPALLAKDVRDSFLGVNPQQNVDVVLDITPDGLLKRIKLTSASNGAQFAMVAEVLSVSTPVIVHRPAPADTVGAAALSRTQLDDLNL